MRSRNGFNPKRRIRASTPDELKVIAQLAEEVTYGGNPEHKMNPGDFGLTPPSGPRPGKSLCDSASIFSKAMALKYLKQGLKKGLVSDRSEGIWPKNVWAVTEDGFALEAQLENPEKGTYHGYPMPESDPMVQQVLARWAESHEKN